MKHALFIKLAAILFFSIALLDTPVQTQAQSQTTSDQETLDARVQSFLERQRRSWRDMNVSATDGQILYDLIVSNNYTRALEIGTSTGHSGTWIAWALSKTGGKLITIDIDEQRHRQAVENFTESGLIDFIDARLADAHELVPELEGLFDFVFSDADKPWYTNYFTAVYPKLAVGGCFVAHNVTERSRTYGIGEFLDYVRSLPTMETTLERGGGAGMSVSFKRGE